MTFLPMSEAGAVAAIAYECASPALRRAFALLQRRVCRETESADDAGGPLMHDPVFDVVSFYVCGHGRVVATWRSYERD
jgi:hypothetical protein